MKRVKKWFLHNPWLKLLSLALGFIGWLIVVNTSNPKVSTNVTVSYDVLNEKEIESSNQVYFTNVSSVAVSYSVRMKYKSQITADKFSAYVNMEDYAKGSDLPVYIEIDSEISGLISDVIVNPATIHITTEKIQQKKFNVETVIEGVPAEGYRAGDISVTPESIYVKGPVSAIGKISSVGVTVVAKDASSDISGVSQVTFYDANGNALAGIEDNLSFAGDVTYLLPVYRIKSLTVNAFPGGAPATGYAVDTVETSPTFISVYGPEEILNEYSYILIPGSDLNISGMSDNITFNIDTKKYIPEGLTLATQTPEITVYVKFRNIFDPKQQSGTDASVVSNETVSGTDAPPVTEPFTAHETNAQGEPGTAEEEDSRTSEPEGLQEGTDPKETAENGAENKEEITESAEESLPAAE